MLNESTVTDERDHEMNKLMGGERRKSKGGKDFMTTNKKRATTVRSIA
jgi:hypothetical protein